MHKRDYAQSLALLGARPIRQHCRHRPNGGYQPCGRPLLGGLSHPHQSSVQGDLHRFRDAFQTVFRHRQLFDDNFDLGTAVGALLHAFGPEAAGSGIPQVKAAYWKDLGYIPIRIAVVNFRRGHSEHRRRHEPGTRGPHRADRGCAFVLVVRLHGQFQPAAPRPGGGGRIGQPRRGLATSAWW